MTYSSEQLSPTLCRIRVTVPQERYAAAYEEAAEAIPDSHRVSVGNLAIHKAAAELIQDASIPELIQEAGYLPLSPVRILEDADFFEDGSYSFAFEIEVLPEIRLPENLESVHLAVEEPLPDPREFQHAVMTFQRKKAVLHTVEERRLPKEGDVLRVNLLAFSGEHLLPRLSRKDFTMILRAANDNMSEVEAAVRKLLAGEKTLIHTRCPEDYPDLALRNSFIDLEINLVSISREELPAFDEELAKASGFPSLKKMKEVIFDRVMSDKIKNIQSRAQKRLMDMLLDGQDFPLPGALVSMHKEDCLADARAALSRQGKNAEELEALLHSLMPEIVAQAEERSRMQAFLLAFAVREHLEITQEEADQQILQIAQRSHQDYNSLHNSICKSKLFHDLQLRLLAAKALNVLYKKVSKVVVDSRGNPVPAPERTEA